VTSVRQTRASRLLPLALVGVGIIEITTAPSAGELSIAPRAAYLAAYALRALRRPRGRERLAALGAATAVGHP
jgi:hypothetical protein